MARPLRQTLFVSFMLTLSILSPVFAVVPGTNPSKPKGPTLSGQVENWYFGELVLRAEASDKDGSIVVLATSRISRTGAFSITLPATSQSFAKGRVSDSSKPCKDVYVGERGPVLKVSGPGHNFMPDPLTQVQVGLYAYEDVNVTSSYISVGRRKELADSVVDVNLVYSETAGSWTGGCVGTWDQGKNHNRGETFDYTYNLDYHQGWNTELVTVSNDRADLVASGVVGPVPADTIWFYEDYR